MDYEKKYKEALELARVAAFNGHQSLMEGIFPELKESDDERIREYLIRYIDNTMKSSELKSKLLAWLEKQNSNIDNANKEYWRGYNEGKQNVLDKYAELEKQGEQKSTLPKWKYKKDNTTLLKDSLVLNKYGHMAKLSSGAIVSDVWVLDYDELAKLPKEELEEQGGQKPTLRERYKNIANSEWFKKTYEGMSISDDEEVNNVNKIEPKFKVGDTIRPKGSLAEYTIESISGDCYHGKGWGLDISCDNDYELVEQKPAIEMITPEESLGIDSETYNKIVDECIYGDN